METFSCRDVEELRGLLKRQESTHEQQLERQEKMVHQLQQQNQNSAAKETTEIQQLIGFRDGMHKERQVVHAIRLSVLLALNLDTFSETAPIKTTSQDTLHKLLL